MAKYSRDKQIEIIMRKYNEQKPKPSDVPILSYAEQFTMTYFELCDYYKKKYGLVPYPYFCNETCRSRQSKNSRTKDGLVIHHIGENELFELSSTGTLSPDYLKDEYFGGSLPNYWAYQQPDMLCYCNYLEHLLLHVKIRDEFHNDGGSSTIIRHINDWILHPINVEWNKNCYDVIKNELKNHEDSECFFYKLIKHLWTSRFLEYSQDDWYNPVMDMYPYLTDFYGTAINIELRDYLCYVFFITYNHPLGMFSIFDNKIVVTGYYPYNTSWSIPIDDYNNFVSKYNEIDDKKKFLQEMTGRSDIDTKWFWVNDNGVPFYDY